MSTLTLDAKELRTFTGQSGVDAQARWLTEQGVPYRLDGRRLLVGRTHADAWLGGKNVVQPRGFDLSAVK